MTKLVLSNIWRTFGTTNAVAGVDLAIAEGEFVSLLGPSGCGKTTTLRMMAGFIPPSDGTITIAGDMVSSPGSVVPPERRNMSMIFQSYAIWPNMTVEQNVGFGLELRKLPKEEVKTRVGEMLEVVQMGHLAKRYPGELSGGQQQRVALARAIVIKPSVLLLDEPLSNLDANLREEMRFEIRRLHDEFRITTVYVTHDQGEAMVTSDRVAVMNEGRIEQCDDPFTVYNRPKTRFVAGFIGRTNFVEAQSDGTSIKLNNCVFPADALGPQPGDLKGKLTFSVRPQTLILSKDAKPAFAVEADVVNRAYLGDLWDYTVRPTGVGVDLRVTTTPAQSFEVGQRVWLGFDPSQMALVAESKS